MTRRGLLRAALFASGGGTNVQALLDDAARGRSWSPAVLISDRPTAGALQRAERAGVPAAVVRTKGRDSVEVAAETLACLESHGIDVIFLAGYLKLVPAQVIARYRERILNVHPALLPAFGGQGMYGMRVHEAVLASGVRVTGPTVHFVDEEYDQGRIVAQWPVPVFADDAPESLARRVLEAEHRLYPEAAEHVCRAVADGREVEAMDVDGDAFVVSRVGSDSK